MGFLVKLNLPEEGLFCSMNALRLYWLASSSFGAGFSAYHGHTHRMRRVGEPLPTNVAVVGMVRDAFIGGITGPLLLPGVLGAFVTPLPCPLPKN